jgi:dihydropteroate synthase
VSESSPTRKRYVWKLKDREIQLGDRTLIVGILNVTPDSFSDGGLYFDPDRAFAHAMRLEEQGADIIDIGAESTRPGSARVSEAEEKRRLIPVLKRLRGQLGIPISIDTYKAAVAENALELGAEIINDPSGLTFDPLLAKVITKYDAGLILNHMRGTPESWAKLPPLPNIAGAVGADLDACVHRARMAGVDRSRIVIDPGLGFGKRGEQNFEILAQLDALDAVNCPILVAPSRKLFIRQATERTTEFASVAAMMAAILGGAHLVRMHDVEAAHAAAQVADAVLRNGRAE